MSHRERIDYNLALKLQYDRIITILDDPFEKFDQIEIDSLLTHGIRLVLQYNFNKYAKVRLFKSRFICEIKRKITNKLYEKSCLIVQSYNDTEKTTLLTQAPTIQQCS